MLDDALEFVASGVFDVTLGRNEDRGAIRWVCLFAGTVLALGGLGLLAAGRTATGVAVLFAGGVLFGIGV